LPESPRKDRASSTSRKLRAGMKTAQHLFQRGLAP